MLISVHTIRTSLYSMLTLSDETDTPSTEAVFLFSISLSFFLSFFLFFLKTSCFFCLLGSSIMVMTKALTFNDARSLVCVGFACLSYAQTLLFDATPRGSGIYNRISMPRYLAVSAWLHCIIRNGACRCRGY